MKSTFIKSVSKPHRGPPVFRRERRDDRPSLTCIFPDGHVVAYFERTELGQSISYVKIAQSIGVEISGLFREHGHVSFRSHAPLVAAVLPFDDDGSDVLGAVSFRCGKCGLVLAQGERKGDL